VFVATGEDQIGLRAIPTGKLSATSALSPSQANRQAKPEGGR